jgi:hypothetical protein
MENYLGFIEAGFVLLVLIGVGVVEFAGRHFDKKYKDASTKKSKADS